MKALDFSSPAEEQLQRSAYSQRSIFTGQSGGHSRKGSAVKKHRDESYTDEKGRVHHPKKWGAGECQWKAHDIESLTHLIEEAWRNKIESRMKSATNNVKITGGAVSTPLSERSTDSGNKPRFVTNCDWVGGASEDKTGVAEDMGEYFSKEREERAHSRTKSALRSPRPLVEVEERKKDEEDEQTDHKEEPIGDLPKRSSKFCKKYAKQTSWRAGEVEAIEGLIEKAAAAGGQGSHHKSHSSLHQRPVTPCARICLTKVGKGAGSAGGGGSLLSPNTERAGKAEMDGGKVKYQLRPVELKVKSKTPTTLRQ